MARRGRPRATRKLHPRKRSTKILRQVRVSSALDDAVLAIVDTELRPYTEVGEALMLLGAGVWRRLREHPSIAKGFVFGRPAELLLLADRQIAEEFFEIQKDEADRVIARSHRFNERSEFYK